MSNLVFREVNLSDVKALSSLMGQLGYPIEEGQMRENLLKHSSLESQKAWVAVLEEEVIGCIAVSMTHYFHRGGSFLRIISMVVDQNHRRKGIGKKLIKIAEEYAEKMGCLHLELTSGAHRVSLGSHDFYRSLGYIDLEGSKKYFGKKLTAVPF